MAAPHVRGNEPEGDARHSIELEQAVFDALPARIRDALNSAKKKWSAVSVTERLGQGARESDVVAFLRDH